MKIHSSCEIEDFVESHLYVSSGSVDFPEKNRKVGKMYLEKGGKKLQNIHQGVVSPSSRP